MSEGNLLDPPQHHYHHHRQHHHQQGTLFNSSRDSELELLDTTTPTTSSPEVRSRSQSVGSAHREALLFFEQHRLFQNSPELEYGKEAVVYDCELRSISSCSRNSSPAVPGGGGVYLTNQSAGEKHRHPQSGNIHDNFCHQQQVLHPHHFQRRSIRQKSDSSLLESSRKSAAAAAAAVTFCSGGGESSKSSNNQRNNSHCFDDPHSSAATSGGGRARSQSQGQCGSVRRRQDTCSNVIIVNSSSNSRKRGDSTNASQSGGSSTNGTRKASKWLEEIQFTAQYQHYRTNNYASVVSSASSLDKSDGGTGGAAVAAGSSDQQTQSGFSAQPTQSLKDASEAERSRSSSKPTSSSSSGGSSSHHRHQFKSGSSQEAEELLRQEHQHPPHQQEQEQRRDDLNRQNSITTSQCWNFPRVKLKKLFTAKSLDDIIGRSTSSAPSSSSSRGGVRGRKSLQVASSSAQEEVSVGDRSSSSPEFTRSSYSTNTKKAQLLRDNKLTLPRIQQIDDKTLLIVKPAHDGSKSPGARSSKSAIVFSTTAPPSSSKQRKGPTFIKATRQKSRSFSALTSVLLSRVPGHSSSSANSPCSSTTSSTTGAGTTTAGLSFFTKRSHQERKNVPPVIPVKKSGQVVPCAKSDNCLNRFVASATCAKFVDYFSDHSGGVRKSATSASTLVEPFLQQQQHQQDQFHYPGTPSSSSGAGGHTSSAVVTAQPRKWTAIKNKWDQKLQASGDRQKEIGASLASVSNNAQIFRKTHHHHQSRQRSNSLSPLDNPEDGKSIESLLEITSPSPTLQEVRFLDTPEIRYASPIAVRSSRGDFGNYNDEDDIEDDSESLTEGASIKLGTSKDTLVPTRASSACSSDTESCCSECKLTEPEDPAESEMTRHHGTAGGGGGGTKRSRDHHHHHHHHHHRHHSKHHGASGSASKEKPKLVVANVTYLQRPMSPGLVLREHSPSSSPASGTIDMFGNVVGSGATEGCSGGNYPSSSVIRNNNVFTSNINNQQSKSQQAKLEFLKSFASPSPQPSGSHSTRDPLRANNSSNVNANERQGGAGPGAGVGFSGAFSASISPSSSGGASDTIRSSASGGDNNIGIVGTNNAIKGRSSNLQGTVGAPLHQVLPTSDLQDPFNGQQRGHFPDANVRSSTGDPLAGGSASSNRGEGAEQCGGVNTQSFFTDNSSTDRCSQGFHQGATTRGSGTEEGHADQRDGQEYGARSKDGQSSGRDPGNTSGGGGGQTTLSGGIDFSFNRGGPLALAQESSINNNLYVDVDFEGNEDDTMGDLQSPQYVKRTAHMFDSRFSTEHGTNGHERNGRNPSYLNVSRSVSGYSCLTYNNGTVTSDTVTNRSVLGNGTSLLSSGTRVSAAAPRLKTDFALHAPFSRNKVPNTDDDSSDHSSNQSATSPPPSLPPINAPSGLGRFSENSFFQNGMNRGEDLLEDTPYIPSHGKSFVMQRIERLYGSDAVSNKGVVSRKSSSHVTTISITRESPGRGKERIIPIKVEGRENHQNNLYNNSSKRHEIHKEERVLLGDGKGAGTKSTFSTGLVLPGIRGSTSEDANRRGDYRRSRIPVEDTDEDEEVEVIGMRTSPTKVSTSASSLDNSGHLNGNANHYRNGISASGSPGKYTDLSEVRSGGDHVKLEHIIHTNGKNHNDDKIGVDGQEFCNVLKKALSRESSADSEDTNGCSEASLELGNISEGESRKLVLTRKDSQEDCLYSSRGATSPVKPKPKPKPKDMALLRTLSRSPALKTGTENLDKTAISLSIVQPDTSVISEINSTIISSAAEDQVDADYSSRSSPLTDIKNIMPDASTKSISPSPHVEEASSIASDKPIKSSVPTTTTEKVEKTVEAVVKDGNYFINEMKKVTHDILRFSDKAAEELETLDPSDDRAGSIHAAIGKGNLLVKKKFKQFEELCNANLKGSVAGEPETTNEDLAGFWDMVMIQVDQIYSLFADLEKKEQTDEVSRAPAKSASPRRTPASTSKPTSKVSVGTTPKVNSAAAKARDEARRKMLAEKRRAMKSQMQEAQQEATSECAQTSAETEVHIFAPEAPQTG